MNPYQVLQIPPTASRDEIRSAYRSLVRRWHPDRFTEGPERDWANEKMADINTAYQNILRSFGVSARRAVNDDGAVLKQIGEMIDNGEIVSARKQLMALSGRSAEWNYLLGKIFLKTQDLEKARIYLTIATHQQPDDARYVQALKIAQGCDQRSLWIALKKRFSR